MTQFWFGFITAVAVIAVTIITGALLSYRRSERKRQAHVDAIMAKVAGQAGIAGVDTHFRHPDILAEEQASNRRNPQGKKGIH